jgi:hypothetical protein
MVHRRQPFTRSAISDEVRAASCLDAIEAKSRALAGEMYAKTHGLKRSSSLLALPKSNPRRKAADNTRSAYISRIFLEKTYIPGLEEGLRQQKEELAEIQRQRYSLDRENENLRQQILNAKDFLLFEEFFPLMLASPSEHDIYATSGIVVPSEEPTRDLSAVTSIDFPSPPHNETTTSTIKDIDSRCWPSGPPGSTIWNDKPYYYDFIDCGESCTDVNVAAFYDFINPWSANCEWSSMVSFDLSSGDVMVVPCA